MAEYIAREWSNGDIVTASNLNSMEQGIAEAQNDESSGGGLVLRVASTEQATTEECANGGTKYIYDHTYQEVMDAAQNGRTVTAIKEKTNGIDLYYFMATRGTNLNFFSPVGDLILRHNDEGQIYLIECEDDGGDVSV